MWKNALKLLLVLFLRNRIHQASNHFGNDFSAVKNNIVVMAESRAAIFKQNFNDDLQRMLNSFLGYMLVLLALTFSGLTATLWLVASAWNSQHRDSILAAAMLLPLLIGISIFVFIRHSWKKQPLLSRSIQQIESDWLLFRDGFASAKNNATDISDEAHQ
jgi:uncharacterized membrane protein YqjE